MKSVRRGDTSLLNLMKTLKKRKPPEKKYVYNLYYPKEKTTDRLIITMTVSQMSYRESGVYNLNC